MFNSGLLKYIFTSQNKNKVNAKILSKMNSEEKQTIASRATRYTQDKIWSVDRQELRPSQPTLQPSRASPGSKAGFFKFQDSDLQELYGENWKTITLRSTTTYAWKKKTRRKWHFQLIKSCVCWLFWCPKPGWNKQVGGAGCDPGQMTEEKQKHLLAVPHSRSPQGLPSGLTPKSPIFNFTVRLQSSTSPDREELLHRHQILTVCNQTYGEKKPQQQWSDMLQGRRYFQRIIQKKKCILVNLKWRKSPYRVFWSFSP